MLKPLLRSGDPPSREASAAPGPPARLAAPKPPPGKPLPPNAPAYPPKRPLFTFEAPPVLVVCVSTSDPPPAPLLPGDPKPPRCVLVGLLPGLWLSYPASPPHVGLPGLPCIPVIMDASIASFSALLLSLASLSMSFCTFLTFFLSSILANSVTTHFRIRSLSLPSSIVFHVVFSFSVIYFSTWTSRRPMSSTVS